MKFSDLKAQPRWVCYDASKAPINARTGRFADSTDPATWTTYDVAANAVSRWKCQGVGFVFNGDGIVGIDLDDCLEPIADENGERTYRRHRYARHLMEQATSYAETSPSGTGIHIFGLAKIPRSLKTTIDGMGVEIYDRSRYFTYTGEAIGDDDELHSVQEIVDEVFYEIEQVPVAPVHDEPAPIGTTSDKWIEAVLKRRVDAAVRMVTEAPDGTRHHTRIRAARLLGGYMEAAERAGVRTMTDAEAIDTLMTARPPEKGAQRKERHALASGLAYGRAKPVTLPTPPQPAIARNTSNSSQEALGATKEDEVEEKYHLTDLGNGMRLVRACGDRLCYVAEWKQWLVWDGRRWAKGDEAAVVRLAHRVALGIYAEIADGPDEATRKDILKWAMASESALRIDAMIKCARPYLTKPTSLFDTHAHLFNVANGTVDLRTNTLHRHDPAQYLTRLVEVPYIEGATSSRWGAFLQTVFQGDSELIDYVQRAVGYTVTGHTDEHCLFFCYGDGANGKSTFMKALEIITTEYATTASIEALLEKRNDGDNATPTVAGLVGMRLATAQEMPDGKRFDESLIKSITGGDTISARMLYGSLFKFVPTHTLWLTGNHKPRIVGTDAGIWRRIRIVPFTANIPPEQRRDARAIAAEFHEDAPAILQWALEGARRWYAESLGTCTAVEHATTEYRGEEDIVARFLQTMCIVGESRRAEKSAMYLAWKQWAEDEGERGASFKSQRWVLKQLETRRIVLEHDRRFVYGVGLIDERSEPWEEATQPTRGQLRRAEVSR